ncbi:MAG: hypothetical protein FWH14_03460 [Oscillospiraceae bacterium]|nr:hypothetical protein [Oscillospiraceae bacterium]
MIISILVPLLFAAVLLVVLWILSRILRTSRISFGKTVYISSFAIYPFTALLPLKITGYFTEWFKNALRADGLYFVYSTIN